MYRLVNALSFIALLGFCVHASSEAPQIGAPAPTVELAALLQAPDGTSVDWQALRGKLVVLEFWATWCGPCIAAIPHLNELAAEFKAEPLQIIAISDEDRETVESFLKQRPIDAWVGIGASRATMESYGVDAIPRTVIVSPEGRVLGVTHPDHLDREQVAAMLRGETVSFPSRGGGITAGALPSMPADDAPLFRVLIQETAGGSVQRGSAMNAAGLTMVGVPLDQLIRDALSVTAAEIEIKGSLPQTAYDVVINRPRNSEKNHLVLLREAMETAFGLKFEQVEREIEVDVLRRIDGVEPTLKKSDLGSFTITGRRDGYRFTTVDMKNVALNIANTLEHPVLDETGIDYTFNAELTFDPDDLDTLRTAVRNSMGLQLVPERRVRTVWVVRGPETE